MERMSFLAGAAAAACGLLSTAPGGPCLADICYGGLVTVPDTLGDRVLAFSQIDGTLYRSDFIAPDGRMAAAKDAPCSRRDSVLVSDRGAAAIFHYGFDGSYLATITDGPTSGLADPRGLMVIGGQIYAAVGAGPWADTIQRFEFDGSGRTTWADTHLSGPTSLLHTEDSVYITCAGTGSLEHFGLDGAWRRTIDSGLTGVEQVAIAENGGLLVATARGIRAYDAGGTLLATYAPDFEVRGVFELTGGEIMFTTPGSVRKLDVVTGQVELLAQGGDFEYIQPISFVPGPAAWMTLVLAAWPRRRR